jgi:hypothetical protein
MLMPRAPSPHHASLQEGGMFHSAAPWPWRNRPPVVVLADKPKLEMDKAVAEMLK